MIEPIRIKNGFKSGNVLKRIILLEPLLKGEY